MDYTNFEERLQLARKRFENHKAEYHNYGDVEVLTWRFPNSIEYSINYIFNARIHTVCISGDLGCAVVELLGHANLQSFSTYRDKIDYFLGKIRCTTDQYCYPEDEVEKDLQDFKKTVVDIYKKEHADLATSEPEEYAKGLEAIDDIIEELPGECGKYSGWDFNSELFKELETYADVDYYDLEYMGRRVDQRIFLWLEGAAMAYEQVKEMEPALPDKHEETDLEEEQDLAR